MKKNADRVHITIDRTIHEKLDQQRGSRTWDRYLMHLFRLESSPLNDKIPTLKRIIAKYPGKCSLCPNEIKIGDPCLWGSDPDGAIIVCPSCQVKSTADKALIHRDQLRRELNRTIQAYKHELARLAYEWSDTLFVKMHHEILVKLEEQTRFFMEWDQEFGTKAPLSETNKIHRIQDLLNQATQYMKDFQGWYESKLNKWKKEEAKPWAKQ